MNIHDELAKHIGWIDNVAKKFCKDRAEAADLAGETIIKCLCHAKRFDCTKALKPWIFTVMANTFKTLYVRKKCIPFTGYDVCESIQSPVRTDDSVLYNEVVRALVELNNESICTQSVMLYVQGYNYAEIASMTGIGIGSVKSRIREGRKMLKKRLSHFIPNVSKS